MLFVRSDDPVKLCSVDIGFENFYFVKKEISCITVMKNKKD